MISHIQSYKSRPLFCAKIPNRKLTIICDNGKKVTVDKFISDPKNHKSKSVTKVLQDVFFELFPNLDKEYKKMFEHYKNKV